MDDTDHPHRDATCETAPWHIWHVAVYEMSGHGIDDIRKYVPRERIQAAYDAGEAAWMVADEIQVRVKGGRLADREDSEIEGMRRAIRWGLR